jgi:hypothetical protein
VWNRECLEQVESLLFTAFCLPFPASPKVSL